MARPSVHAVTSLGLAIPYWKFARFELAPVVACWVGVLTDLDHLVDLVEAKRTGHRQRVILPLHGWEYMACGWAAWLWTGRRVWLGVACSAYTLHLVLDLLVNKPKGWTTYSILYRISKRFEGRELWPAGERLHRWMGAGSPWQLWRWL